MKRTISNALLILSFSASLFAATQLDPAPFDAVLAARARNGGFDYKAVDGQDKKRLAAYLANIADAKPAEVAPEERKAFYINAYNAIAIQALLDHPGKKITNIDGAFRSKHKVGGEMLSLDDIENKLREFKDARIHFAIVCASRSCPPLAPKAYRAEGLSAALDKQARLFINDPSKNVIDKSKDRLSLSMIFNWNRKEFERDGGSLPKYISKYANDPATASWVASFSREPDFLEYDWSPNQP